MAEIGDGAAGFFANLRTDSQLPPVYWRGAYVLQKTGLFIAGCANYTFRAESECGLPTAASRSGGLRLPSTAEG